VYHGTQYNIKHDKSHKGQRHDPIEESGWFFPDFSDIAESYNIKTSEAVYHRLEIAKIMDISRLIIDLVGRLMISAGQNIFFHQHSCTLRTCSRPLGWAIHQQLLHTKKRVIWYWLQESEYSWKNFYIKRHNYSNVIGFDGRFRSAFHEWLIPICGLRLTDDPDKLLMARTKFETLRFCPQDRNTIPKKLKEFKQHEDGAIVEHYNSAFFAIKSVYFFCKNGAKITDMNECFNKRGMIDIRMPKHDKSEKKGGTVSYTNWNDFEGSLKTVTIDRTNAASNTEPPPDQILTKELEKEPIEEVQNNAVFLDNDDDSTEEEDD